MIMYGEPVAKAMLDNINKYNKNNHLVIITVGEDEASEVYVGKKVKTLLDNGFRVTHTRFGSDVTWCDLERYIVSLNTNDEVQGIMVQKPIKSDVPMDVEYIDSLISPSKDVDGQHKSSLFSPCTPKGIMAMFDYYEIPLEGKFIVVAGRSDLVAKPLAKMLMDRFNCTVVMVHSRTNKELVRKLLKECDVFVSAIGKPHYWKSEDFVNEKGKKLALIDVGINRLDGKLVGDVSTCSYEHFINYTPVPRGVGVVTVSSLVDNLALVERENK